MERPEYYGNPAGITDEVDVVRQIYAAFADRDIERALLFIDPECEIVLEGTMTAAGRSEPYHGHDGMRQYFADVMRVWEELELHATDYRVVPGSVVVMGHVIGRLGGQPGQVRRAVVWTWRLRDERAIFMRASDMGEMRD